MIDYKRFSDDKWREFGNKLIAKDGNGVNIERQAEFLTACKTRDKFLAYVESKSAGLSVRGETYFDIFGDMKLCEREYFNMPDTAKQKHIWEKCRGIPKDILASSGFWAYEVVEMIRKNLICPSYLAYGSPGNNGDSGAVAIDKAIRNAKTDGCTRRVLRSLGNVAPRGGQRVLFVDFSLGKSYWCWHWAENASKIKGLRLQRDDVLSLLSDGNYNAFAEKMNSGQSYISLPNVFAGMLLYMNRKKGAKGASISGNDLKKIINRMAYLISWKALESQLPVENEEEIRVLAESISIA